MNLGLSLLTNELRLVVLLSAVIVTCKVFVAAVQVYVTVSVRVLKVL